MEEEGNNLCGVNQLDADVRLPPRKRLLAGLKKQNCDCASPLSPSSSGFSTRLLNLLRSDSSAHLSPEEIVDASRSAALAAAKVAAAAKAAFEEKSAVAAKAAAAAKSALQLVVSFSEKKTWKGRYLRKNKPQKHIPVKLLYKKRRASKNCETDEELARRLHRAMNSSPRISKNSIIADRKAYNHKKLSKLSILGKAKVSNGGVIWERNPPSICDSNDEAGESDFGVAISGVNDIAKMHEEALECTKDGCSQMEGFVADREAEPSYSKDKNWQALQATGSTGRKRGRIKQKKLSLSLCATRDSENPKEEPKSSAFSLTEETTGKCTSMPLIAVKPSGECEVPVNTISVWKHNGLKAPQCFAENNVIQSICSNAVATAGAAVIEVDQ